MRIKSRPEERKESIKIFSKIRSYQISFTDLPNPNGTADFTFTDINGEQYQFCEDGKEKFSPSILIGCEVQYRYFVLCGGRHEADHAYGGNGIKGLGNATYYNRYHSYGDTPDQGGSANLQLRGRMFTYAKQCFLLASIGQTFAGKTAAEWYNEGVKASFKEFRDDAQRYAIQAFTGGDSFGSTNKQYPASLTQATPYGDRIFNYPYTYSDADIDTYLAAHPFSAENLGDQIWVYGYLDPYTCWTWWRKTGYPKFKEHATPEEAATEMHAYLEQPYVKDAGKKVMPRRGCMPDRNTLNANYLDAKAHLLAMPGFGEWNNTEGGIWWETPYM